MAADPLEYVNPGDPFVMQAAAYNEFVDAAKRNKVGGLPIARQPQVPNASPVIIKIKNNTGGDLDRFAVLSVGDPVFDADDNLVEFQNNVCFEGNSPGAPSTRPTIAVTTSPLKASAIGRAVILGETIVKVEVSSGETAWKYVKCISSTTSKLAISETPSCGKIIWKQTGTGTKWAAVLLMSDVNDAIYVKVTADDGGGVYSAVRSTYAAGSGWTDGSVAVKVVDPNGNPLKTGARGLATFVGTSGGNDYYMGTADLWDDGTCP